MVNVSQIRRVSFFNFGEQKYTNFCNFTWNGSKEQSGYISNKYPLRYTDYGRSMKPSFIEIQNCWAKADKFGR